MTSETSIFLLLLLLGLVHLSVGAVIQIAEVGLFEVAKSRDNLSPIQSKFGKRGERANHNFKETLPWALSLLILIPMMGKNSELSVLGAWIYFWSRVAYLPLYVFGVPVLRSLSYGVALLGLGLMVSQLF